MGNIVNSVPAKYEHVSIFVLAQLSLTTSKSHKCSCVSKKSVIRPFVSYLYNQLSDVWEENYQKEFSTSYLNPEALLAFGL